MSTPVPIVSPAPPSVPVPGPHGGRQEIRPGLELLWSEAAVPPPPPGAALCMLYRLSAQEGSMSLHRPAPATCDCAVASFEFYAVIALSASALRDLLAGDQTPGANRMRHFVEGSGADDPGRPLTPVARFALESIRRCPFVGACRAMAVSARCHDLLVEFLSALAPATPSRPAPLLASHADRIRAAADLVRRQLEQPPSLGELATRAGLSETTLKRGFHQVFGTTVYGYIRARRMEQAHRLLETGAATVLEAATLVGYSNPSNFSAAFRRQFGVNPKTFQLRARRLG